MSQAYCFCRGTNYPVSSLSCQSGALETSSRNIIKSKWPVKSRWPFNRPQRQRLIKSRWQWQRWPQGMPLGRKICPAPLMPLPCPLRNLGRDLCRLVKSMSCQSQCQRQSQCHVKVNVSVKVNDAALTACSAASLDLNASASASAIKRSTSCILRRSPWSHSFAGGGVRLRVRCIAGGCDFTGGGRRSDSDAGYHNQNQRQAHTVKVIDAAMINQGQRQAHTPPHVCVHARSIWTPCIRTNERKTTSKQRERLHRMDRHINKLIQEIFDELTIHDRPMSPLIC